MMNLDDQLLGILKQCDKEQLNKYMEDDEACDVLIKSLDQYQSLLNEKENLEHMNRSMAQSNLELKPVLESQKAKLRDEIEQFERARKEYLDVKDAYEAQMSGQDNMSSSSIYNSLHTAAQRAEEETDKMADEFFSNTSAGLHAEEELSLFQKQFLEARTQAHLMKIKAEKLKELIP